MYVLDLFFEGGGVGVFSLFGGGSFLACLLSHSVVSNPCGPRDCSPPGSICLWEQEHLSGLPLAFCWWWWGFGATLHMACGM